MGRRATSSSTLRIAKMSWEEREDFYYAGCYRSDKEKRNYENGQKKPLIIRTRYLLSQKRYMLSSLKESSCGSKTQSLSFWKNIIY
jgi:hypothetical protein